MALEEARFVPSLPARRAVRRGPKGRTDVNRPTDCPDGHGGRIRVDRVKPSGLAFTRVGYRCAYLAWDPIAHRWVEKRHRFFDRVPGDPLPRRHPTTEHSYSKDGCPHCEHKYTTDEGPRAGRKFYFTAGEIAKLLIDVGQGASVYAAIADTRRDALRFRPET